ncbi:hypothetical protein CD175_08895 [Pseudomonas laurylsulfatiphila]|uniref:Uncharacterized protein n=1 Tax=Pseudomonas laurylsulfatiphila TaxID=2011015 RepID=A0A2S6FQH3_9PSED|nr:hypothetical protein CD175_08895 [Pseudomonas laurylsulfatiphila]
MAIDDRGYRYVRHRESAVHLSRCLRHTCFLWRGSLLPLGCAAAPKNVPFFYVSATHSSGSKLPRHGFSLTEEMLK